MINILDDWMSAINSSEVVGILLLDLLNAFDLVNHAILLHKHLLFGLHDSTIGLHFMITDLHSVLILTFGD